MMKTAFTFKQMARVGFLLIIYFSLLTNAYATHIVGGELSVIRVDSANSTEHRISLIIYFDEFLGNQDAKDETAIVYAYRKSDNQLVESFTLNLVSQAPVEYSNPECASVDTELSSSIQFYTNTFFLDEALYDDPDGYYFIYDRCCRNGSILNIDDPGGAGQLFYLEFPPIVKDGQPFVNSSPGLFPPLRDFACLGQPYYTPFGGEDADGDSLVYSMAVPLNGLSSRDAPLPEFPSPSPYPTVQLSNGYQVTNMVRGSPALNIDQNTGFLTVTPNEIGLFVFAVLCEEYRDGVKIGEVRRDFQMKVISCPDNEPPVIEVESADPNEPPYIEGDTIRYTQGDGYGDCIPLRMFDNNTSDIIDARFVPITTNSPNGITLTPVNRSSLTNVALAQGESLEAEICFPECSELVDEIYQFSIIVGDRSCSVPLLDTATFTILVESSPNQPAEGGSNTLTQIGADGCFETSVLVGETINFDIFGIDPDGDSLRVVAFGSNVDLAEEGIDFEIVEGQADISSAFEWTPTCENLGPNNANRNVEIFFVVEDYWKCGIKSRDTVCVNIDVGPPLITNNSPEISSPTLVATGNATYTTTVYLGEDLTFDISALDIDNDAITLEAFPQGFDFEALGMSINTSLAGVGELNTTFTWTPGCEDLLRLDQGIYEETFPIQFVAKDVYGCDSESETIITVNVVLVFVPDDNIAPVVGVEEAANLTFDPSLNSYCDTLTVGEAYELNFWATDNDADELLFLEAVAQGFSIGDLGIEFENQEQTVNQDTLRSRLFWQPDCDALTTLGGQSFSIEFITKDENTCKLSTADTLRLKLYVQDVEAPPVPPFPNAFSPNGDGISEAYIIRELPADNCADEFIGITIYNRWGVKVFESQERDFAWDGVDAPAGVYFYHIKYKNSDYKGSITLFRGAD